MNGKQKRAAQLAGLDATLTRAEVAELREQLELFKRAAPKMQKRGADVFMNSIRARWHGLQARMGQATPKHETRVERRGAMNG